MTEDIETVELEDDELESVSGGFGNMFEFSSCDNWEGDECELHVCRTCRYGRATAPKTIFCTHE